VIRAWRYVSGVEGRAAVDPARLLAARDRDDRDDHGTRTVVWVDLVDPTDDERATLASQLHLDPTVVEALRHPKERTKLQRYGDYFHVAVHDFRIAADRFSTSEVDIVMGPGWLVTVRLRRRRPGRRAPRGVRHPARPHAVPPRRGTPS
jgi:Mg2+ and Co2+ transporter CorA